MPGAEPAQPTVTPLAYPPTAELIVIAKDLERVKEDIKTLREARHQANNDANAVHLQLANIAMTLASQDKSADRLAAAMERLETSLNGDDTHPGLKGRLDRLEQTMGGWVWLLRAVVVAVIAMLVQMVWRAFGGPK